jgi:guanosine-3',5'-bis(diphosphate) 3'-pyrophosphohydrolase
MVSISPVEDIIKLMKEPTEADKDLVRRAYDFAHVAHSNQKRKSGDPYFVHVVETAKNLASLGLDSQTITAGLLHDTIEDAGITRTEVELNFGETVRFLVDGVTKLGELKYHGDDRRAESLRKLLLAMAEDIRVIIIKLADRLHNIKTLEYVDEEKQRRIALETLEIYAPLANRLGMGKLQADLEDNAFPYAYKEEAEKTLQLFKQNEKRAKKSLEKVFKTLSAQLAEQEIDATISYRLKHVYSLYKKLIRKDWNPEKIYDVMALRIITNSVEDCYRILGLIHAHYRPLPGRVKDYIALPKPNGYKSIHTTVFTGDGEVAEIQIRTKEMHAESEYGIATHLIYKESGTSKGKVSKQLNWVKQLIDWQKNVRESKDFIENLKLDFFQYRVFTFTPNGDVIELPEDATPVDFAYAVHTEIGDHVSGAKVNGKLASLSTKLKNGDIVEVMTSDKHKPSYKWLDFVKTSHARRKIRGWISKGRNG